MSSVVTVSSGLGPIEVRWFVRALADALARELTERGAVVEAVVSHGAAAAPRSVDVVLASGDTLVTDRVGTHVLVSRSERRGRRSRKRWFVSVSIRPTRASTDFALDTRDLVVTSFRAGGAGGQHVNKTESAVRVAHAPSGIVVRADAQRSRAQNLRVALERLRETLADRTSGAAAAHEAERRAGVLHVKRGAAVATWVMTRGVIVRLEEARDDA